MRAYRYCNAGIAGMSPLQCGHVMEKCTKCKVLLYSSDLSLRAKLGQVVSCSSRPVGVLLES